MKNITIISSILLTIFAILFLINSVFLAKETLEAKDQTIEYGENLDSSKVYYVKTSPFLFETRENNITYEVDYDKEYIGTQKAKIFYRNLETTFNLTIDEKQIETPKIGYNNNKIYWNKLKGAENYLVIINDREMEPINDNEFDLNFYNFNDTTLNIQVMAIAESHKYKDSYISNLLRINKLINIEEAYYNNISEQIEWKKVNNAIKYNIWINDEKFETYETSYKFNSFLDGINKIKIQAVGNNNEISSNLFEFNINKLYDVANIKYEFGKVTFDTNNDLETSYLITVNGKQYETKYTFLETDLVFGKNEIEIQSINYNSNHIESKVVKKEIDYGKLEVPKAKVVEETKDKITFKIDEVKNANLYEVTIKRYLENGKIDEKVKEVEKLTFEIEKTIYVKFVVSIKAKHNKESFEESIETSYSLSKLDDPTIKYDNDKFIWDDIENNIQYKVVYNDNEYIQTNNYIEILKDELTHDITVQAIGDKIEHYNSNIIEESFNKLKEVFNVRYYDGLLYWDSHYNNKTYLIHIDDEEFTTTSKYLEVTQSQESKEVKIQVISDKKNDINSNVFKDTMVFKKMLDVPNFQIRNTNTFTRRTLIREDIANATKYTYFIYEYDSLGNLIDERTIENPKTSYILTIRDETYSLKVVLKVEDNTNEYNENENTEIINIR